ncbi:hypothetical protein K2173_000925 [Erythroxylum novogranatense]|uniref:Uncharacterized protein n=1 Tax=Erythroxylum novogranatense TaxID=1862640 RepID=A0AAV8TQD5_9ROSI|nr:hypothetical protein K2173_000925 [Erythroxylum novogranatense]
MLHRLQASFKLIPLHKSLFSSDFKLTRGDQCKDLTTTHFPELVKFINLLQSIANITSLKTLSLYGLGLIGSIQGLSHLTNLQGLHLSVNNLSGNLPYCLVNFTLLQVLDLSDNHFIGKIAQSLLKFLTSLLLEHNQVEIRSSLSPFFNHSKLNYFNPYGNEVYTKTGVVNHNLAPKFHLESLSLSSTSRGGSFLEFLYHQHDLQFLDISSILMIGLGFLSWLLENNTLESLLLSSCSLFGSLGFPTCNPNAILSQLDISKNQLYGPIPTRICAYFLRLG